MKVQAAGENEDGDETPRFRPGTNERVVFLACKKPPGAALPALAKKLAKKDLHSDARGVVSGALDREPIAMLVNLQLNVVQ